MEYQGKPMRPVSKEEFFKAIGHGDVHPYITNPYAFHDVKGYINAWETRDRVLVGLSYGRTHHTKWESLYFLPSQTAGD